jgi:hypothetical protein
MVLRVVVCVFVWLGGSAWFQLILLSISISVWKAEANPLHSSNLLMFACLPCLTYCCCFAVYMHAQHPCRCSRLITCTFKLLHAMHDFHDNDVDSTS